MKTAYPSTQNPVTITLYSNIPFDNTYKHHTMISRLFKYNNNDIYYGNDATMGLPCERFLNRREPAPIGGQPGAYIYNRWTLTGEYNFNFSNGLLGSVVLELTNPQTNANYMKLVCGNDIYYYFITGINQINTDTYALALELDVLMTYQDEFLNGMKDVPVFTTRKHSHRYTSDGLVPYCADLKTGDDAFTNVKPNIIETKINATFDNANMKNLEGIMWLNICCEISSGTDPNEVLEQTLNPLYNCNSKVYPLAMVSLPINVQSVTYKKSGGSYTKTFSRSDILSGVKALIGNGKVHGCKITPYPPFDISGDGVVVTFDTSRNLTLTAVSVSEVYNASSRAIYQITSHGYEICYGSLSGSAGVTSSTPLSYLALSCGGLIVRKQLDCLYEFGTITPEDFDINNLTAPTIHSDRYLDPKLLFAPFKKYIITAQYSGGGYEFFPELVFSEESTSYDSNLFSCATITSAYIGDNNYFTYIYSTADTYRNYRYDKIGLSSNVNYIFPCGTNALDVFNSTQAQTFYQSKTASGITSALTMVGGIGSVALGVAGAVGTMGMSTPMSVGLIATGVGAVGSGVASMANTIKSTNAKIEDLKNTPDSINISGSNFVTDECISEIFSNGLPYYLVYRVSDVIRKNADDYFYQYGYQVARDCYFNTDLYFNNSADNVIDNNLFGRTIFNYIQINEDITNKINADIPLIIKQKISAIFNNGITIWNFFGFAGLWSLLPLLSGTYVADKWFLKNKLDNTEYKLA